MFKLTVISCVILLWGLKPKRDECANQPRWSCGMFKVHLWQHLGSLGKLWIKTRKITTATELGQRNAPRISPWRSEVTNTAARNRIIKELNLRDVCGECNSGIWKPLQTNGEYSKAKILPSSSVHNLTIRRHVWSLSLLCKTEHETIIRVLEEKSKNGDTNSITEDLALRWELLQHYNGYHTVLAPSLV